MSTFEIIFLLVDIAVLFALYFYLKKVGLIEGIFSWPLP